MNYEYVDSEIEWTEKSPSHWKKDKLFRLTQNISSGGTPTSTNPEFYNGDIFWVQTGDLNDGYLTDTSKKITKYGLDNSSAKIFPKGTLLVAMYGATIGKLGIMTFDGATNQACCAMNYRKVVDSKYMFYMFLSMKEHLINKSYGGGQPNISQEVIKQEYLYYPPIDEQKQIANYLDRACEKIDNTIKIKEQQIQEINRYKQSRFFEVLMRGLKQEESQSTDVLWMPKIPISWKIKRIKDISHLKSGDGITSLQINDFDTYPVYGGNGLRGYTSSYTHEGDFVLIGRQGALCGNINYANGVFWASEHAVVCRPIKTYDVYWFGEMLRLMNLNQYSNAAAQPGLAVEKVKNLKLPFPPYNEQVEITKVLKNISTTTDNLIQKLKSQIKTLKDYRKSLIFECVTGKKQIYKGEI